MCNLCFNMTTTRSSPDSTSIYASRIVVMTLREIRRRDKKKEEKIYVMGVSNSSFCFALQYDSRRTRYKVCYIKYRLL